MYYPIYAKLFQCGFLLQIFEQNVLFSSNR
jgi:hypothetical protein